MFDLHGKTALVTGSTQGIGFAIAKTLSEYGAKVFIHGARNMEKCKTASEKVQGSVPICVDLSEPGSAKKLHDLTGDVDILILNASVQYKNEWDKITSEEFDTQVQVNFKTSFEAIQIYAQSMKEKGCGRIITVGSVQQYRPHNEMAIYAATKCAQMSVVRSVAKQLAPYGISVNNLSPGVIATPRNDKALNDPEYSQIVMSRIPMGFAGESEDMSGAALLLCSDAGRYITGTDIVVDGGMAL